MQYHETVWSDLFAGNKHTTHCLQPAVLGAEIALELAERYRQRTVWRLDGGGGSDAHLVWLLGRRYHVVAKGMNNRRAEALARQVKRWDEYAENAWLGEVEAPIDYGRPVRVFVKKRFKNDEYLHSYYLSSLSLPSKNLFVDRYDARGGAEVEQFRNDKGGLGLEARRKWSFTGQTTYVLLTDLAHNLIASFQPALADSPFVDYGIKRIVRDLLTIPGKITFNGDKVVAVSLLTQKQFSQDLLPCLIRYISCT
jgi:hypothetical protein